MPPEQPVQQAPRNLKKYLWVGLAVIIIIGGLYGYGAYLHKYAVLVQIQNTDTSTWQTYRNEEYGFEIKIPKNWTYLSCMDNVQLFLYSDTKNIEDCDAPKSLHDMSIIGPLEPFYTGPVSFESYITGLSKYRSETKHIDGYTATRYYDIPMSIEVESPPTFDMVLLKKDGTNSSFLIDLSKNSPIEEQIFSTFKFTESIPSTWQTYRSEEYGFEIKYPSDWTVKKQFSNANGFFVAKGNSFIAILPNGEFDNDNYPTNTTILKEDLAGKSAVGTLLHGGFPIMYQFMDPTIPTNWSKCDSALKNCNRIELKAATADDASSLIDILYTFRFLK